MKKVQKITILAVILTAFITSFTGSALNLAIPDISTRFGISVSRSGWVITIYTMTVAALSIPAGLAADKTGRKRILNAGLLIFAAASLASALAPTFMIIIISRGLQGVGAAMIFSTNTAILTENFSDDLRGHVLGYSLAATYIGLSAGPFFGGIINHYLSWRYIFAVTFSVSAAALILSLKWIPRQPAGPGRSPDPAPDGRPARMLRAVLTKPFVCSNLAAMLNYGATFALSYLISIFLQVVLGYSSRTAGMILLVQPVMISILSPLAGRLSDSVSPFKLAAIGMTVCAISASAWPLLDWIGGAFSPEMSSIWPILIILAVTGAGSALFSSPNTNAVMSCAGKEYYSIASSALATMRSLGNTLGMLVITATSSIYIGNEELRQAAPEAVTSTIDTVFVIAATSCAAGIILSIIKPDKRS